MSVMPEPEMTATERDDLRLAKEAYDIFRGSQRSDDIFIHWNDLSQRYKELLCFVVAHARQEPTR